MTIRQRATSRWYLGLDPAKHPHPFAIVGIENVRHELVADERDETLAVAHALALRQTRAPNTAPGSYTPEGVFPVPRSARRGAVTGVEHSYRVRFLERRHGRSYVDMVNHITALLALPRLADADVTLVTDCTGVGAGFQDMLREVVPREKLVGVVLTSGHGLTVTEGGLIGLPTKVLFATLQVAIDSGRLRIAKSLSLADAFLHEFASVRRKFTASGNVTFEFGDSGGHGDLMIAAGLALAIAERDAKRPDRNPANWTVLSG